ncbi:MAG TPA: AAA family ATPase, partial [Patescibacteria group bacterium]|nr:AAA family ATPase [Patescibacteria group bacterium]
MYLKRLEIQGFKSFAHKTTMEFAQGVIAIVGPNGSGKSNVADAIRWVLGEQSPKIIRGKKSDDVIFAGS